MSARPYDYWTIIRDKDPLERMLGWLGVGPGVCIRKQDVVPHVQFALIVVCATKLSPKANKEEERYLPMATEYMDLVLDLFYNRKNITEESLAALKKLAGCHNKDQGKEEHAGWPSGCSLYQKYKVIKKTMRNELLPSVPKPIRNLQEIHKNLPSGHGVQEFVNHWLVNVYVKVQTRRGGVTEEACRLAIDNDVSKVPDGFFERSQLPISCLLAAKVFMHHPVVGVAITRQDEDAAKPRSLIREESISGSSSGGGSRFRINKQEQYLQAKKERGEKRKIQLAEAVTRRKNAHEWKKNNMVQHVRLLHDIGKHYYSEDVLKQKVQSKLEDLEALDQVDPSKLEEEPQGMLVNLTNEGDEENEEEDL